MCDQETANTSTNEQTNDTVNQDELILQQTRQIEKEISDNIPFVGELEEILSLRKEYDADVIYLEKIKDLASKYASFRRTRPDGNCFFRALSYAYFEHLITNKKEFETFLAFAQNSIEQLVALGFPQLTLEDFHEAFVEVLNRIGKADSEELARDDLHRLLNEQGYSDYVVVYLRLITSGHLQKEADFYQNFIEGHRSITEFCHQEVEPMYKESDHIHIIAVCSALSIGVRVEYMDRGDGGTVIAHDFPEGSTPSVFLLYRPGHYDILYKN